MRDPIRIEIQIDRASVRRVLLGGGILVLTAAAGMALAVPGTFKDGDVLSAADLNQSFSEHENRIAALESFKGTTTQNGKYSLGGVFCGNTANTPGDLSGLAAAGISYAKAKAACEVATGCSEAAHVCTADEIYRTLATGPAPPAGWIMDTMSRPLGIGTAWGCDAFTSKLKDGTIWGATTITNQHCDDPRLPLLCCD